MKKFLGPLCEGSRRSGWREPCGNPKAFRAVAKVQPLRPCRATSPAREARGGVTINFASPSYTPPADPANCTPRQCGTARPEACSGHSAGVPTGLCGRRGRLKFQQTARGALHRTACPYSRSADRTGSGRPADGSRPHRGPVDAVLPQQIGQRRAGHALGVQQVPPQSAGQTAASVSYCL